MLQNELRSKLRKQPSLSLKTHYSSSQLTLFKSGMILKPDRGHCYEQYPDSRSKDF